MFDAQTVIGVLPVVMITKLPSACKNSLMHLRHEKRFSLIFKHSPARIPHGFEVVEKVSKVVELVVEGPTVVRRSEVVD